MPRRSSRKRKRQSLISKVVGLILTAISGGLFGGWYNPDLPVLGPLVQQFVVQRVETSGASPEVKDKILKTLEEFKRTPDEAPRIDSPQTAVPAKFASVAKSNDTITIATFNIQVFGDSKMSKSWVVDILAQVCRQFDVVAIQEVRTQDDQFLPKFVQAINADGSRYAHVVGPRLGRTVSTEQYAFVYDSTRIELDPSSVGTMGDPADLLHREPMVARFRRRPQPGLPPFTFWLVNIHTDPDEVSEEVDVLADVFQVMGSARQDEDDVILLGDLNADEHHLGRLGEIPGITWAVSGTTTNTRRNKAYDNLIFQMPATREYTGRWGVVDLEQAFQLTRDEALKVSDHLPVWAEFTATEADPRAGVARNSDNDPAYNRRLSR